MEDRKKIIKTARETLNIEREALGGLVGQIDNTFAEVILMIYRSPGRLVVTGIGKSALVGQKMVATFNSTGSPALFMHAADAIHGDLGMIGEEDQILVLSKSGETSEIKVLLPLLRQFGTAVIGMTGESSSYLARESDFVLRTPVEKEADPNNLAPTASSIAQMAMGDAMATALLALRGFSPRDFAQYHPGGSLGKQLYLRVKDLYPLNEKPIVRPDASIRDTILEMTSKRLGATVVGSPDQMTVDGIITDGDLRRMLEREEDVSPLSARDVMTLDPLTIGPESFAVEALNIMRSNNITQLIVKQDDRYLGMVHLHDLIREGIV